MQLYGLVKTDPLNTNFVGSLSQTSDYWPKIQSALLFTAHRFCMHYAFEATTIEQGICNETYFQMKQNIQRGKKDLDVELQ